MQFIPRRKKQQHYMTSQESATLGEKATTKDTADHRASTMVGGGAHGANAATNDDKQNLETSPTKKRKRGYPNSGGEDGLRPPDTNDSLGTTTVFHFVSDVSFSC
jgi:hypothetical protein